MQDAAGKLARGGRGQGCELDQQAKVAIEAMNMATEFYADDWEVEDVHGRESYDLICRRGSEIKHVEVKWATTDGAVMILPRTMSGTLGRRATRRCSLPAMPAGRCPIHAGTLTTAHIR